MDSITQPPNSNPPILLFDRYEDEGYHLDAPGHPETCWDDGCNECQLHAYECLCAWCVAREAHYDALHAKAAADQREAEVEAEHQRSLATMRADQRSRQAAEEEELDRQQFRRAEAEREEDYSRNTARELVQEEADVKREELDVRRDWTARSNRKLTEANAADATNADTPEGLTLDALAAVFDDEVDLTPVPAVLERIDGGLVLPAGKLNWDLRATGQRQILPLRDRPDFRCATRRAGAFPWTMRILKRRFTSGPQSLDSTSKTTPILSSTFMAGCPSIQRRKLRPSRGYWTRPTLK